MNRSFKKSSFRWLLLTFVLGADVLLSWSVTGQVFYWGESNEGQTNLPTVTTNVVSLTGGDDHCVAMLADRTVTAWGGNYRGQTNVPSDAVAVQGIAAGSTHSLAVLEDGSLRLWGSMISSGVSTVPPEATNVVAVAMGPGAQHALALRADGSVLEWGAWDTYAGVLADIPHDATNIVSVAAGAWHSVALRSDGRVVAWGWNNYGQTNVPHSATNVVAIAAGWYHSMGLRADGSVLVWGLVGSFLPTSFATPMGATNLTEIACGGIHLMALRKDGKVFAWPNNGFGQANVPVAATNLAAIAGTSHGSMAAKGEGPPLFPHPAITRAVASGKTAYLRQTAVGAIPISYQWRFDGTNVTGATNSVLAVSDALPHQSGIYTLVASNSVGVATNSGMLLNVWPVIIVSQPQTQWTNSGTTATLTVSADGQSPLFYQWQYNGTNIVGATNGTLILTNVQGADGGQYTVVVSNSLGVAKSSAAQLNVVPVLISKDLEDRVIFRGGAATLKVEALSEQPVSYQWHFNGMNLLAATNSDLVLTNVKYDQSGLYSVVISNALGVTNGAGNFSVVAVASWGANASGQTNVPASLTNVIALAGGSSYSLALKTNGTLSFWGNNGFGQGDIPQALTNVVSVTAGALFSLALKADGTVSAWGYNSDGQTNLPIGLTNVVMVRCGGAFGLALRGNGTVVAWGSNSSGETNVPTNLNMVRAIAAGSAHALALRNNGTVIAWGSNSSSQTNVPPNLTNVVAIAAGSSHSMALKADGKVDVWGSSSSGLQNVPPEATNIIAIEAGSSFCVALRVDGEVFAWGTSADGRSVVPSGLKNVITINASSGHSLALVGDGPPLTSLPLSSVNLSNDVFSVSFRTRSGRVYELEYKDSLEQTAWTSSLLAPGTGGITTLTDSSATSPQRYYRVREW